MSEITFTPTRIDVRLYEPEDRRYRQRTTSRIYIFQPDNKNEKPVRDILSGFRYNKPHISYRTQVVPLVLERMGLPKTTPVRWSQKAGCSCGCSPGFIVESKCPPKDVFVDVKATVTKA